MKLRQAALDNVPVMNLLVIGDHFRSDHSRVEAVGKVFEMAPPRDIDGREDRGDVDVQGTVIEHNVLVSPSRNYTLCHVAHASMIGDELRCCAFIL
jgi:hypothetical protein